MTGQKTPRTPTIGNVVNLFRPLPANDGTTKGSKVPRVNPRVKYLLRIARRHLLFQAGELVITALTTKTPINPPIPTGGWTRHCGGRYGPNYAGEPTHQSDATSAHYPLVGQSMSDAVPIGSAVRTASTSMVYLVKNNTGLNRWGITDHFTRPLRGPTVFEYTKSTTVFHTGDAVGIATSNMTVPFWGQPYQGNSPFPQGNQRFNSAPGRAPAVAPSIRPDIVWTAPPAPAPTLGQSPGRNPGRNPNPATPPRHNPGPSIRPPSHRPTRPGKGQKEPTKNKMTPGMSKIWAGIGIFSEVGDVIDIAYSGLPKKIRDKAWQEHAPKGKPGVPPIVAPHIKAWIIYQHGDKLDGGEIVKSIIKNEIEDRLYAAPGKFLRDHTYGKPWYGRPVGLETGPAL